jgi:hypothetical protein
MRRPKPLLAGGAGVASLVAPDQEVWLRVALGAGYGALLLGGP